jgi:ubiquinone/menaquinone biosynthesis C-methylase UbiE
VAADEATFTKYEDRGAYHWQELSSRLPTRYSARLHALYDWFRGEVRDRRPGLLVDVGCGDAALTHLMSLETPGRIVGIEPENAGVAMARGALEKAGSRAEIVQGRGEDLPFEDGSVDMVVMCEVVEHIEPIEPLFAEAARVLAPGGAMLVSTPQWQKPELRPFHVREFRAHELRDTCLPFFEHADVLVSEPPRIYDAYVGSVVAQVGVNAFATAGLNPFRVRRPAEGRPRWRELHCVATKPRRSA